VHGACEDDAYQTLDDEEIVVSEIIFRTIRIAVAVAVAAYCGLMFALVALTSFRLDTVGAVLCALMFVYALAMLAFEVRGRWGGEAVTASLAAAGDGGVRS
jgi:hypothetical protein